MKKYFVISSLLLVLLLMTSCASYLQRDNERTTEQTLLRAGFKAVPITANNQQKFKKFPSGKISTATHQGKRYFFYPEHERHELLVGGNKQFMQYNELVTDQLPAPSELNKEMEYDWIESSLWGFY